MLKYFVPVLAFFALAIPGAAMAQAPDPPTSDTQPTPLAAPALPASVTDEASAGPFARAFLISRAGDLIPGARALDVSVSACAQVDAVQRYYCLLKARLFTVQRIEITRFFRGDRNHGHNRHKARAADDGNGDWTDHRDNRHNQPRRVIVFRVRLFACVAVVKIVGGPSVTPQATIPVRDCVRINPNGTPVPTPTV